MAGNRAFNLLKNYHRSSDADTIIPTFNDEELRSILEEINVAFQENHLDAVKFQETRDRKFIPMIGYRHALLQRNKRCCLAYLYNRLQKLKEIRWHLGPTLSADVKKALTEPEVQWFNNYSKLLATYMYNVGEEYGINLTADIKPPKSLYIEVRCLVDYGKFELDSGETINLKKNSQHYLPKSQCEALIRQGILQHIIN